MDIKQNLKNIVYHVKVKQFEKAYINRFLKYGFLEEKCVNYQQYEASITKMYHGIEKGLAHTDFRPGFGIEKAKKLVDTMKEYSVSYDCNVFFYQTCLAVLYQYIETNREYGFEDAELFQEIESLPGKSNNLGGSITFTPPTEGKMSYEEVAFNRHSIRHFSPKPVSLDRLKKAIVLAQHTPSACNRQGWKVRIVEKKEIIASVLENQNGSKGFASEINKLLIVTSDLRYFNRKREVYQAFIDGGMYAMSLIEAIYYYGIAAIPLSASLKPEQENRVRSIIGLDEAEVLIMFIGVGNYPQDKCVTTRSERKPAEIIII